MRKLFFQTLFSGKPFFEKYFHSSLPRLLLDGLSKFGVRMTFIYRLKTPLANVIDIIPGKLQDDYEISFWGEVEIKQMSRIPGRTFSGADLLDRLNNGCQCYGVKYRDAVASFVWINFEELTCLGQKIPLQEDEVHLFDLFTVREFRGKGLAPVFRLNLNQEMKVQGINTIYGHCDYFNRSARNYQKKIKSVKERLELHIVFFNSRDFHFTIKKYNKISVFR